MLTENGLKLDMDAVNTILKESDVLTIGFTLFAERLLVDLRYDAIHPQFAELVEPVANAQERYLWLGQHRGSLGAPKAFAFFGWPQTVRTLIEQDTLAPLRERLTTQANLSLASALNEAARAETAAIKEIVRGTQTWPAVWQAQR